MNWDADTVRAYVDGELDDLAQARIVRQAQGDDGLAAAIEAERELRDALGAHFAPILVEPMPERLTAPIDAARKVVSLDAVRARRFGFNAGTLRWAAPAMAAALVLAVMIPGMRGGPVETRDGLSYATGDLAQALETQLVADQRLGGDTRVMLSFADEAGTLCRGFARAEVSGIACRETGGWHLRLQRDGIDVAAGDYRQASSVDSAIMAAAQDMASGPAFDAAQERAAKARGWRAR